MYKAPYSKYVPINLRIFVLLAFLTNTFGILPLAQADEFRLPVPGVMVHLSPEFNPPILKGIKVHPDNPFRFDFILDQGDSSVIPAKAGIQNQEQLKIEATRLIKYFLASLTIPEKDLWVNLSPYEKDRIIPNSFGLTEMGRDLLAEDYMLKQITASLIYPEDEIGKKFWKRVYEEAQSKYGTTSIPVNTFNKVWIVPEKAVVYENAKAGTAYVVESKLKVMLEQDYLALSHNVIPAKAGIQDTSALGSQIVREIVIPELTKEINEGKNFAQLRQVYNSLILATWYKKKIKDSILGQVYENKNKVAGVNISDPQEKQKIYERYLQAFKKGVYNYIKEDQDPLTRQIIPRKYFSGGTTFDAASMAKALRFTADAAVISQPTSDRAQVVEVKIDQAMVEDGGAENQLNLPLGSKLEIAEIPKAQAVVQELSQRVNDLYRLRGGGAFIIQQYIPVGYRDNKTGEELPADIHGGRAMWIMLKDLFQSDVFKKYYLINGLKPKGQWDSEDVQRLIQKFIDSGWITAEEKANLIEYENDIDKFLQNYMSSSSYDRMTGLRSINDGNIRYANGKPEEEYKQYYQKTGFVYSILSRVFQRVMTETLPSTYSGVSQLSDGFQVKELEQGFYIDLENQFHLKVKGEGEAVRVIDFPEANIQEIFQNNPELLVKVFQWAAKQNAVISNRVLRSIGSQTSALKETTAPMREAFFQFIKIKANISLLLLKMYQVGLLGKFLPEYEELRYHFEVPSHRFSVVMHSIYLLYFLENVLPEDTSFKKAQGVYQNVLKTSDGGNSLATLRFAILFHDAQKEIGRANWGTPHPIGGSIDLTPRLLNQFPGAGAILPALQWLVWHHQEWGMRAANTRYVADTREFYFSDLVDTVELGQGVLNQDLLNELYLLTVADANSVDPYGDIASKYFDSGGYQVTTNIFLELSDYLTRSDNRRQQEDMFDGWRREANREDKEIQQSEKKFLTDVFKERPKRIENLIAGMKEAVFQYEDRIFSWLSEAVGQEALLDDFIKMYTPFYLRTLKNNDLLMQQFILFVLMHNIPKDRLESRALGFSVPTAYGPMLNILIGTNQDVPGIMYKTMGVLAAMGFNILNARINTTPEGVAFDNINGYFLGFQNPAAMGEELLGKLPEEYKTPELVSLMANKTLDWQHFLPILMNLVIKGAITVDDIFKFNGANQKFKRLSDVQQPKTRVDFGNDILLNGKAGSVLGLKTADRNGLLYIVSRLLSQRFGLNIEVSPISTEQTGINDRFIVTKNGKNLSDEEKKEIKGFLEDFLEINVITQEDLIRAAERAPADHAIKAGDQAMNVQDKAMASLTDDEFNAVIKKMDDFFGFSTVGITKQKLPMAKAIIKDFLTGNNGSSSVISDLKRKSGILSNGDNAQNFLQYARFLVDFKESVETLESTKKKVILLVDDDIFHLSNMHRNLVQAGYFVIFAKYAREALEELKKAEKVKKIDLVVSDWFLIRPNMHSNEEHGIWLFQKIQEREKEKEWSDVPFILQTRIPEAAEDAVKTMLKGFEHKIDVYPQLSNGRLIQVVENKFNKEYRIMVIEHEPSIREKYRDVLLGLGYQVEAFDKLGTALAEFRKRPMAYSFVISNFNPGESEPDMNGVKLARQLAQIRPDINIVINTLSPEKAREENSDKLPNIQEIIPTLIERGTARRHDLVELMQRGKEQGYFYKAVDSAMKAENVGGIDLTPANMHLQTQNSNGEIKFHLDAAQLAQLQNAPGFTPVIITIRPMTDLRSFLGLK